MAPSRFAVSLLTLAIAVPASQAAVYEIEAIAVAEGAEHQYVLDDNGSLQVGTGSGRYSGDYAANPDELAQFSDGALLVEGEEGRLLLGFDTVDDNGQRSGTTSEMLSAVNGSGWMVGSGSAPYRVHGEDNASTRKVRDFSLRAFATADGDRLLSLPGAEVSGGGISRALDINDAGLVIGYASVATLTSSQSSYDSCIEDGSPELVCRQSLNYQLQAWAWQLDGDGNISSSASLGLAYTPAADDDSQYQSQAYALNNAGLAVGYSQYPNGGSVLNQAALFSPDGNQLLHEAGAFAESYAYGLSETNADGITYIVGQVPKRLNDELTVSKFFIYDHGAATPQLRYAQDGSGIADFFEAGNSLARAVNRKGQVVGWADYERVPQNLRRRHGFIYDIADNSFRDLNQLIPCDSGYEIVDAVAIDDDGNILVHALLETDARDADGVLQAGEREQVVRSLWLRATAGNSDECPIDQIPSVERQGASFGLWPLLLLLLLPLRRRFSRARA